MLSGVHVKQATKKAITKRVYQDSRFSVYSLYEKATFQTCYYFFFTLHLIKRSAEAILMLCNALYILLLYKA